MSLTTLADCKVYLGITDSSKDALIEIFRKAVEQSVINFCDTDFTTRTIVDEKHDSIQSDVIVPKYFPILSVQKVAIGELEYQLDQYYFDQSGIMVKAIIGETSRGEILVSYTAGYASVPDDVKLAVYQAVKAEYQRKGRNTEDIGSRSKDGESENYNSAWDEKSGLPKGVAAKLQAYKVYEIPNIGMAQRNT
jgi:hypothetical protein